MLTENDVVNAVCSYLQKNGYEIKQKLTTNETGIDIVATNQDEKECYIEAKGATSSKPGTSRYGKEFNQSQVKTHIGMAMVASFKARHKYPNAEVSMAFPKNNNHESLVNEMRNPLIKAGIGVLLVNDNGEVEKCI